MDSSKNNKDELADSKEEQLIESNESKITKAEKRKNYIKEYNSRYYQENANKILEKRKEKRQMKVKTDIATSNTRGKNPNDSCSDDDFEEKHLKKLDDARLYKKQWYEKNAQRIKQERSEKYLKEKEAKDKIIRKIFDSQRNDREDELDDDDKVSSFYEKSKKDSIYKKEWYKKNAGKMKEQYDPAKRAAKYQKEKEAKAAMNKKIQTGDIDQLDDDISFHKFMNREENEKMYKKEWYEKNAEKIKARKKESYNPIQKKKEYQEAKVRMEGREKEKESVMFKDQQISHKDEDVRRYNSDSKWKTNKRFYSGSNKIHIFKLDKDSHTKLWALESMIEDVYKKVEDEINRVKLIACDFATDKEKKKSDLDDLYAELHLKHCNEWHSLQLKIDALFKEISRSKGIVFSCEDSWDYCSMECYCCKKSYDCHNHKELPLVHKYGLQINRELTTRSLETCKVNSENLKTHNLSEMHYQKINALEIQVYNLYQNSITQMNDFFDKKEGKDYGTILIPAAKYEKFWKDLPLSQELTNNWKDLRTKIKDEFMDIAKNLDITYKFDDEFFFRTCEICSKKFIPG